MQGLARMLAPLHNRVMLMVSRAVVRLVQEAGGLQQLQVDLLAEETRSDAERFQDYGFASHPHAGAEAVALSVGGNRDHVIVIAVADRRYRLAPLQAGEVAIYTDEGDHIVLKRGGTVEVLAATKVDVRTPLVECSGDLVVRGALQVDGAAEFNANVHVDGALAVDGNVTSGADITAAGHVADQGGAKTMAAMRTAYNGHKHGNSAVPSPGM